MTIREYWHYVGIGFAFSVGVGIFLIVVAIGGWAFDGILFFFQALFTELQK